MKEVMNDRRNGRGRWAATRAAALAGAMAAAVALPAPGSAQEVGAPNRVFDLESAVELALDANRDLEAARYTLEEARERVSEAWSNVWPSLDFTASYTRNLEVQKAFLPAVIFDPDASPGEQIPVQFGSDNTWSTTLNAEQILFDPRVFIGVGAAGRFETLQQEVVRGQAQTVVTRVRIAYYDLLLAQEEVRLNRESVERVEQSLADTRAMNEAGLSSDYDVLRLEVELANLRPALRRAENRAVQASRNLAVELALDDLEGIGVTGSLAEMDLGDLDANSEANRGILAFGATGAFSDFSTRELVTLAVDRRSDVRQSELTTNLRHTEMRVEQVEYLPKVSLFGSYSVQAQENGRPDFFGESSAQRATSQSAGIQVSIPIFTGLQRDALVDQRRAVLRRAEAQTRLARDRAAADVRNLVDQLAEARERARGQKLAVAQAQRGFEIASAEYREGIGSQLQLTDAEVALRQSEFNYAQAVYDFLVAQANLDQAAGQVPVVDKMVLAR